MLPAIDLTMTPEECSAEILKVLFGYLPEEIRNNPDTGTVITVPAAFNQMQKDATMQAANMAGLGSVALMQEPVAAVMSVMRARNTDGIFLIYDLGGGTLDIAIAESIAGRINLLAHGGIAMCGGRDFDRVFVDNIVRPWLLDNFALPEDFTVNPNFRSLTPLVTWATERAKIELSSREESLIVLSENEMRLRDLNGKEIYLEIPVRRDVYDRLISERVGETIQTAREALSRAGLSAHDLERIVFVGGPTNYRPLRDKVSFELGVPGSTDVNPMTAVAEGASVFAESIDWSTQNRLRKNIRGQMSTGDKLELNFNYIARTPDVRARVAAQMTGQASQGSEFQIDSVDTGWTSGRKPLKHGETIDVPLTKAGDNIFKVFMFDSTGMPVLLKEDKIVITRTAATVDAIPASHSIAVEVLEKLGGRPVLEYLVRSGDSLPKKGKKIFKAATSLKAGASGSLNFKLWEGEIEGHISDNRFIGLLKISGTDFDNNVIPAGADLVCEYEILDSGNIILEISIPSIGGVFHSGRNFYSRQEGQINYGDAVAFITEEGTRTLHRLDEISEKVDDPKLKQARQKLESAISLNTDQAEAEKSQEAMENVYKARHLIDQVRKEHLKEVRQIDLDATTALFNDLQDSARPSEIAAFESLAKTAQRSIDRNDKDFEQHLEEMRDRNFIILSRQDWFAVKRFEWMASSPHQFSDKSRYEELIAAGREYVRTDEIDKLRNILFQLSMIRISGSSDSEEYDVVSNIIRG